MVFGPLASSYLEDLYLPELGGTAVQALEKGIVPKRVWEHMLRETSQSPELLNIYRWDEVDIKDLLQSGR